MRTLQAIGAFFPFSGCLPVVFGLKQLADRGSVGGASLNGRFHVELQTPLWFGLYFDSC